MPKVEQVGGTHYAGVATGQCPECKAAVQHWDWGMNLPGLEYAATKYIARHADKAGAVDLEKAISYAEKIMSQRYPEAYAAYEKKRKYAMEWPVQPTDVVDTRAPWGWSSTKFTANDVYPDYCAECGWTKALHHSGSWFCPKLPTGENTSK